MIKMKKDDLVIEVMPRTEQKRRVKIEEMREARGEKCREEKEGIERIRIY